MKKKKLIVASLIIILTFLMVFGLTLAKYTSSSAWDYYLKARDFNFSSDNLAIHTVNNSNSLWDGNSVYFNLKNNVNKDLITDYDIAYEVTCEIEGEASLYTKCELNGTTTNQVTGTLSHLEMCVDNSQEGLNVSLYGKTECELNGYDWESQIAKQNLYFDVIPTQTGYEISDVVVNITATSTDPYKQTLSGKFTLHKKEADNATVTMTYHNYSNYDRLVITNPNNNNKCVKINWNANNLIINAEETEFSSSNVDANGYLNEVKFLVGANKSLSYIFYKKNFSLNYDVNDITLVETSGC